MDRKGATPSDTVARLLKKAGVDGMDKFIRRYAKRKSKSAAAEAPAAPAQAAAAPSETPKAEAVEVKEEPKAEEATKEAA